MREIEFKGKKISDGEWIYGSLVIDNEWAKYRIYYQEQRKDDICPGLYSAEVDPESVGQYTGRHDSKLTKEFPNGQKIYAGDILKTNDHIDYIEWKDDFSAFKYHRDKSNTSLMQWFEHGQYSGTEVIGNKIDNPELLENKK